jgi:hypothetical protein
MKGRGEISPDAVALLEPSYQDGMEADGFMIPNALAQLLT